MQTTNSGDVDAQLEPGAVELYAANPMYILQ
jgi:hypothetical protein